MSAHTPPPSTRALVREAFPAILATGRNPSIHEVKVYVRAHYPDMGDWNPSDGTVSSELTAIRKALGEQLKSDRKLPGLPETVSAALAGAGAQIMQIARAEADAALEAGRTEAAKLVEAAENAAAEAQKSAVQAEEALAAEKHRFETVEARLTAERDSAQAMATDKSAQISTLQSQVDRLSIGMEDRATEIASLRASLENQSAQFTEQLALAEARYRDLERAKLMELDQARLQRDKSAKEAGDWKKTFETARADAQAARKEAAKAQEMLGKSLESISKLRAEIAKRGVRRPAKRSAAKGARGGR